MLVQKPPGTLRYSGGCSQTPASAS